MKKLLALVLALVMTLSLCTISNAAFTDAKDVDASYEEAVAVLNGMGVFKGYEDGSFKPEGSITRAEVAAIVYRLYTGDVKDKQAGLYAGYGKFDDMAGAAWAAGYVGFCANAGFVKGYGDGKFGPSDPVTGYQALAMILRAVGYGKNGEFEGADWELHVAQIAQQLKVLKNVKGVSLKAAASRELVAELLFQVAAYVDTVEYTPAFGYVANKVVTAGGTLGEKNFDLDVDYDTADKWGRPSRTWTYNTGDEETVIAAKPAATYTVAVDECDIAKDLGLTKKADIEKAFIDGNEYNADSRDVTSNGAATINPLAYTSKVGAQGRLTEVYDMDAAGYRIVEINTYLGKVTGVTKARIDKNGHTIDRTVDIEVYEGFGANTVYDVKDYPYESDTLAKGEWVLVNVCKQGTQKAEVADAKATEPTAGGLKKAFTRTTTTIGTTKYDDANKFFLGNNKYYDEDAWQVIVDDYGNLIGLVQDDTNYLVVEAIAWLKAGTGIFAGEAGANIRLADGTEIENVVITKVDGEKVTYGEDYGDIHAAEVSENYKKNTEYYDHFYAYTVDKDGNYELLTNDRGYCYGYYDEEDCTIVNKGTSIRCDGYTIPVNNDTVFMVKNGYSYDVYTGKNEVPSMDDATICVLMSGSYASAVLVTEFEDTTNTFVAFFDAFTAEAGTKKIGSKWYYVYEVYKTGETEPTTIYSYHGLLDEEGYYSDDLDSGFYQFTVDTDGIVEKVNLVFPNKYFVPGFTSDYDKDYHWACDYAEDFDGETLITDLGGQFRTDDTKYISLYWTIGAQGVITLAVEEVEDNEVDLEGHVVAVAYTGSITNSKRDAAVVYVFSGELHAAALSDAPIFFDDIATIR